MGVAGIDCPGVQGHVGKQRFPVGLKEGAMSALPFAPVRENEQQRAFDALVMAFTADPVIRWLYPEAQQYLTHFPEFLAVYGGKAFAEKTAWRLGTFSAVAMWLPPRVDVDGDAFVAMLTETVAPKLHDDVFAVVEQMDDAHPPFPHWYLALLGVDVAEQGRGLGGELMKSCLRIVDQDHLPAYLDSSNPRNVSFYERHGFAVTGEAQAGACPPVISMLRAAR
jgi:ribosomal protein S18 acetylase RimI-like enzyme